MNFPKTLKIGGFTYTVKLQSHLSRDSSALGKSCGNQQEIMLDDGLTDQLAQSTFVHEVLHQLSFVYDLKLDEDAVLRLEAAIFAFIRDNPDIYKVFTP